MTAAWLAAGLIPVVYLLVRGFERYARVLGMLDLPNERSSHYVPTPRGGGLVVVLACIICFLVLGWYSVIPRDFVLATTLSGALIALVGFVDDLRGVGALVRISVHTLAAALAVWLLGWPTQLHLGSHSLALGFWGLPLAVLWIVWSINSFNFMDGTDGLAGSEGLFVFGVGGLLLWSVGAAGLATCAWIIAASLVGFLLRNWPKAKIFMGDSCSGFLGFAVAIFALASEAVGLSVFFWLALYGFFFADATLTLMRRIARGERWYAAHRSHAYQRLHHVAQWSHKKVLLGAWAVNGLLAMLCFWAYSDPAYVVAAGLAAVGVLVGAYILVERVAPMARPAAGSSSVNR